MSKYITTYKLAKWESPEQLVQVLQKYSDDGWHIELSRVYHEKGDSGWTIFSQSKAVAPAFMEQEISFRDMYRIINGDTFKDASRRADEVNWPYRTPAGDVIDAELKAYYERVNPQAGKGSGGEHDPNE